MTFKDDSETSYAKIVKNLTREESINIRFQFRTHQNDYLLLTLNGSSHNVLQVNPFSSIEYSLIDVIFSVFCY